MKAQSPGIVPEGGGASINKKVVTLSDGPSIPL